MNFRTHLSKTIGNGNINEYYLRNIIYENIESIVSLIQRLRFIALGAIDYELDDYLGQQEKNAKENPQYCIENILTEFGGQNFEQGPDLDQYCIDAIDDLESYCSNQIDCWDNDLKYYCVEDAAIVLGEAFQSDDFLIHDPNPTNYFGPLIITWKSRGITCHKNTITISLLMDCNCRFKSIYRNDVTTEI
jgi:hypothetical protein